MFEENPVVYKTREISFMKEIHKEFEQGFKEGLEQGLQEGLQQGEMRGLQRLLVCFVRARYPGLVELARQQAAHFNKSDTLEPLVLQVMVAPDESTVRRLLESGAAM